MSIFSDIFGKALQAINIVLTLIGLGICVAIIIYGVVESQLFIWIAGILLVINHLKSLGDYTYIYNKMRKIANNLRDSVKFLEVQNNQLKDSIDDLNKTKMQIRAEANRLEKTAKKAEIEIQQLEKLKAQYQNNAEEYHEENKNLEKRIQKLQGEVENLRKLKETLERQLQDLDGKIQELDVETGELRANNQDLKITKNELEEQLEDLKELYLESKKLVKNLVLAGDHFSDFEQKFSDTANALKESQIGIDSSTEDLKQTAQLLGNMVNSLADKVPLEKQHLAQHSDIVKKFQNLVTLAVQQNQSGSDSAVEEIPL